MNYSEHFTHTHTYILIVLLRAISETLRFDLLITALVGLNVRCLGFGVVWGGDVGGLCVGSFCFFFFFVEVEERAWGLGGFETWDQGLDESLGRKRSS